MADFKVDRIGSSTGPQRTKKARRTSDSDESFADALRGAAETQGANKAGAVKGVTAVGGVFAVQEVGTSTDGRSRGLLIDYGDSLLDRLEDVRLEILMGAVSKEHLADLAHQMRQKRQHVEDPVLNELIDEIEMRAEIEIAKLTRDI
ncbi:MAG: flagellar assembly protein FliX [Rhodospirillales bacterium]